MSSIGNRVGRAGRRRGAGGNLANWKPGTSGGVRAARRRAGRPGPLFARSARVGCGPLIVSAIRARNTDLAVNEILH